MTGRMSRSGAPSRCRRRSRRCGRRQTRSGWSSGCSSDPEPARARGRRHPGRGRAGGASPGRARRAGQARPAGPLPTRCSIDEAADLIERTPSLAHIVVDEAQDLSPMQCRAIGRRCATGSATVLGDIAQGTTAWATSSWQQMLGHLGKPEAELRVLDTGYRVPAADPRLRQQAARPDRAGAQPRRPRCARIPARCWSRAARRGSSWPTRSRPRARTRSTRPGSAAVIAADEQIPALAAALAAAGVPHAVLEGAATGERHHPGAGHAGQGPGVRPGHRLRAGPDRERRGTRPAPPLRGPDPGRLPADRAARASRCRSPAGA